MGDKILKQNKIPGKEQLTRPSEINALSKYLGGIKEIQEDHTHLDERTLEVKGRGNNAFFPDIKNLDDSIEPGTKDTNPIKLKKLDESTHVVPDDSIKKPKLNLDEFVVKTEVKSTTKELDDTVQKILEQQGSAASLSVLDDTVVEGQENKNPTRKNLDESVIRLEDSSEKIKILGEKVVLGVTSVNSDVTGLNDSIETLETSEDIQKLGKNVVSLNTKETITALSGHQEKLNTKDLIEGLNDSIENLDTEDSIKDLNKSVTTLSNNLGDEPQTLDTTLIKTSNNLNEEIIGLDDSRENILDERVEELKATVTDLSTNHNEEIDSLGNNKVLGVTSNFGEDEVSDLDDYTERLYINPIIKALGKKTIDLTNDQGVSVGSLDSSVSELVTEDKIKELNSLLEKIKNTEDIEGLDNSISNLKVDKIIEALRDPDDIDTVHVEQLISDLLSDTVLNLPFDKKITEIKKVLQQTKNMNAEEALTIVIKLFKDLNEDGSSEWLKKISALLTESILSPNLEDLPPYKRRAHERARYAMFLKKLEEACCMAEVAIWLSAKHHALNSQILTETDKKTTEHQTKRDKKNVPEYQLFRGLPKIKGASKLEKVVNAGMTTVQGLKTNEGMDYIRFGLEKSLNLLQLNGNIRHQMLQASLIAAQRAMELGKKALKAEAGRLPGFTKVFNAVAKKGADALTTMQKLKAAGKKALGVAETLKSSLDTVNSTVNAIQNSDLKGAINGITKLTAIGRGAAGAINRPDAKFNFFKPREEKPTTNYENGNLRKRQIISNNPGTNVLTKDEGTVTEPTFEFIQEDVSEKYINFARNYLSSEGIQTTLLDLCKIDGDSMPTSFLELQKILRESPYISTPGNFTNTSRQTYQAQTLAVNNYWEISMEPLVNDELNGGFSYLPAIDEINMINEKKHGVNTGYSTWIPFVGFDLSTTKLGTKSASLYDGEIVFPTDAEQLNELRLTIADDIYKSWATYFKMVADVSVYSSIPHDKYYYDGTSTFYPITPTYIDHTTHCVALYKNITFRIRIYTMTPQYSTIKNFDLLCVLKDFTANYTGELDGTGGGDLNLSFCVVGENPDPGYSQLGNIKNTELIQKGYGGLESPLKVKKATPAPPKEGEDGEKAIVGELPNNFDDGYVRDENGDWVWKDSIEKENIDQALKDRIQKLPEVSPTSQEDALKDLGIDISTKKGEIPADYYSHPDNYMIHPDGTITCTTDINGEAGLIPDGDELVLGRVNNYSWSPVSVDDLSDNTSDSESDKDAMPAMGSEYDIKSYYGDSELTNVIYHENGTSNIGIDNISEWNAVENAAGTSDVELVVLNNGGGADVSFNSGKDSDLSAPGSVPEWMISGTNYLEDDDDSAWSTGNNSNSGYNDYSDYDSDVTELDTITVMGENPYKPSIPTLDTTLSTRPGEDLPKIPGLNEEANDYSDIDDELWGIGITEKNPYQPPTPQINTTPSTMPGENLPNLSDIINNGGGSTSEEVVDYEMLPEVVCWSTPHESYEDYMKSVYREGNYVTSYDGTFTHFVEDLVGGMSEDPNAWEVELGGTTSSTGALNTIEEMDVFVPEVYDPTRNDQEIDTLPTFEMPPYWGWWEGEDQPY